MARLRLPTKKTEPCESEGDTDVGITGSICRTGSANRSGSELRDQGLGLVGLLHAGSGVIGLER